MMWHVIGSKGNYIVKTLAIGFCLWYGTALYYGIPTMMGWPTTSDIPEGSFIISYTVREPREGDEGGIYLWVRHLQEDKDDKASILWSLDPRLAFNYKYDTNPRSYEIPYNKRTQKKLFDKKNRKKMKFTGKNKKKDGKEGKEEEKIRIIVKDLSEIFKKD